MLYCEIKKRPEHLVVPREDLVVRYRGVPLDEREDLAFDLTPRTTTIPSEIERELPLLTPIAESADGTKRIREECGQMCTREVSWLDVAEFAHDVHTVHPLSVVAGEHGPLIVTARTHRDRDVEGMQLVVGMELIDDCEESVLDVADADAVVGGDPEVEDFDLVESGEVGLSRVREVGFHVEELYCSGCGHIEIELAVAIEDVCCFVVHLAACGHEVRGRFGVVYAERKARADLVRQ